MAEGFKELKEKYLRQMQEMYAARPERGGQQEVERELAKEAAGDAIEGTAEEEHELQEEGNPVFLGAVAAGETVQLPQPARAGRYIASARQRTSAAPGYCQ